jgi:hypothetical protein
MSKIGIIKSKLIKKLTESYGEKNKTELKNILKSITENKKFKEMYLFYEEMENKFIEDKETAKLYVEGLENLLNSQSINNELLVFCEELNAKLGEFETEGNELYESLDQLFTQDTLSNIENKVIARKKLIEHLTKKKQASTEEKNTVPFTMNENLLYGVLANNFNVLYGNTLSEEQQVEFKNIMSLTNDDIVVKTSELKENINSKIESILTESTDSEMNNKLNKVKEEVNNKETSRLNYFRLIELRNGLDN